MLQTYRVIAGSKQVKTVPSQPAIFTIKDVNFKLINLQLYEKML